ncbi:murein hydrolase activator EnvC family protein [Mongoliitalea daihaiensis]|uniref:murein hydrolase activator EnvC family protein n=1 Tax=Mongoliitalea daihaiensis TaxID=2782006 RepID=UPI001F32FD00|nr:peptidoglycan DD-metalloendopeptidase family protein [Mongoliitalea daihaiensis]UJP63325.1 peptidoglycan DD-metalloendopeptidase family protein [Mongoliitalea daihaiensis]
MKKLFIFLFLLCIGWMAEGQNIVQTRKSRVELEKEKAEIQKKLLEFDQILKKTTETKKVSVGQLNAVTKQLQARVTYISTLSREVNLIDREIANTEFKIKSLENELSSLKEEYSKMIYTSAKLNQGLTITAFVFSSTTFKQFYMRLKYLKQYSDARKKQAAQIEKVTEELVNERTNLAKKKEEKQQVLQKEQQQKRELDKAKQEQQGIVNSLNKQEQELRRQIEAARKQQENLNRLIRSIIEEEIRRAEAEAKKANSTASKASGSSIPLTPEAAALSSSFAGNRGKLPWPVESGFVSKRFGNQPHPTLKGVVEPNDGIDIQTTPNAGVRAVFDGEVVKVATVPGYGGTILIKHGEYYTLYSKLKVISVKTGDKVKAKQVIGQVYTNKDGVSEMHFETWKGLSPMDPSGWLAGR